jgi:hypothetical protein
VPLRAMSLNLFGHDADYPARREVLAAGLRRLRPDVVALQEAIADDAYDQAVELLGEDYQVAHQTVGLVADGRHHGASVASRWPIGQVHEVDLHLTCGCQIFDSHHATCAYSWISPPRRSRRTILAGDATTTGTPGLNGGACSKARCGRCRL